MPGGWVGGRAFERAVELDCGGGARRSGDCCGETDRKAGCAAGAFSNFPQQQGQTTTTATITPTTTTTKAKTKAQHADPLVCPRSCHSIRQTVGRQSATAQKTTRKGGVRYVEKRVT